MPQPLRFRHQWTALFLHGVVLFGGFALSFVLWWQVALSPLQQFYFPTHMAAAMTGGSTRTFPVWWIWKTAPKRKPELAANADVVAKTVPARSKQLRLALSPQAMTEGWTGLLRAQQMEPSDGEDSILQDQFFAGQGVLRMLVTPLCGAAIVFLLSLMIRQAIGGQTAHEERHGRRTKGPELASASRWRKPDGLRLRLRGRFGLPSPSFVIPKQLEASHILLMGDTGAGKSNAIRQILWQVQERGESAIVYDPAGEFVQEFYDPKRGDLLLNPLDARCPYWGLSSELYGPGVADAVVAALLPERDGERGFFTDAPRRVLARLLQFYPTPEELHAWMADPAEIDRRLAGTPQAAFLDPKAGPQRAGVLASLNLIADSFALLPEKDEGREWFASERWGFERTRWVFLTSRPSVRERLLPLHAAWLDLLILRMMEPCANPAKPVWFVLDELASLNKLPQLHTAVTENRKYGNPVVLGFQGRSQLEKRYGGDAEAMLSQPATKIFFKTSEPRAARWISETLGEVEVERLKESRSPGLLRGTRNCAMEIATKPLVMASEIAGLAPLFGYIKQGNRVTPVRFALTPKRNLQPEFIARRMAIPEPRPLPIVPEAPPATAPASQPIQPTVAEPAPKPAVRKPRKAAAPVAMPEALPLFSEPAPEPAQPEPRKSAFKKKEGGAREWKPVD